MGFEFSISFSSKKKQPEPTTELVKEVVQEAKVINEPAISSEDFEEKFGPILRKVFSEFDRSLNIQAPKAEALPVVGAGRTSMYEGYRNYVPGMASPVPTTFDFRILRTLDHLSVFNRHISQAVDNIRTLANTDYKIKYDKSVGSSQAAEMNDYLWGEAENWYEFSDGEDSLDNDLLTQLAVYGAISAEAVITPDLKRVQNVVRVDPYFIRFAYDLDKAKHIPLQEIGGLGNSDALKGKYPGYIELNTNTYNYVGMFRRGEMPYAIPPFASALEDIATQQDMIANFKNMMRRLGMLGVLSVLVKAPAAIGSELPEAYANRCRAYLETLRPDMEKGISRGVLMGFEGSATFEVQGLDLNSANAENLMKIVNCLIFSGLKQDPNMNGYNYSTTETFGRVIMDKMTNQVMNYQKSLGRYRAKLFKLALMLAGYKVKSVEVTYNSPSTKDEVREQTVLKSKIENAEALRAQGIIDQNQKAQMLGYEKPAADKPLKTPEQDLAEKALKMKPKAKTKASNALARLEQLKKKVNPNLPEFNYYVPSVCLDELGFAKDPHDPAYETFVATYDRKVQAQYKKAVKKSKYLIKSEFKKLPEGVTLNRLENTLMYGLLYYWDRDFANPVEKIAQNNVDKIYYHYRRDDSVFTNGEGFSKKKKESLLVIPEATFDLLDARAIEFLGDLDRIYLGRFITDADTERRILKWIEERFKAGNVPLGKGSALVADFINEFADLVMLESWKIRRILETTANTARNVGNMYYLNQAAVDTYECIEVMDGKTCGWCRHMNGKKFSVQKTAERFDRLFRGDVADYVNEKPFATTMALEEFKRLDSPSLEAMGYTLAPFHPHCRGRTVAVFG